MKTVLVIGGSYFAGRVFVEEMAARRETGIHVFNRGRFPLRMAGVVEHVGDRQVATQIQQAIPAEDWDAVVDFCAYEPADVDTLLENLPGRVGHYILISTTSVYAGTAALPVSEESAPLTAPMEGLGGDYAYKKWLTECRLIKECRWRNIHYTIFRPAIIYGYYNYAPRETYFFDLLREKKPIVIPKPDLTLFSVIWVGDLAQLILRCIGHAEVFGEAYNAASDELISYRRIIDVLSEITGKAIEPVTMAPAEIERRNISLPFPLDAHLIYSGHKATRQFGIDYMPFKKGLREALKYYLMVRRRISPPD